LKRNDTPLIEQPEKWVRKNYRQDCTEQVHRPPTNAIDLELADEFATALEGVENNDLIAALVVTGAGSCFSAGLDLKAVPTYDRAQQQAMVMQVERASRQEQLALLRAHPDLGTRAKVSDASRAEQEGAGLDRLTEEEFIRLNDQNAAYRERFGFPFLLAVKGITKQEVLRALEERGRASRDAEFAEALRQAYRIARFRLEAAVS